MSVISTGNENEPSGLRRSLRSVAAFVVLLWIISLADFIFGLDLYRYGTYPRQIDHLTGIFFAPLIHGSFTHIFSNTLPLLVLGTALLYGYPRSSKIVMPVIYLGSGLGVWLFGRNSFHIGASSLVFGMMFFVFVSGVLRWDPRAIALSCLVFFLYGGAVWGIFPTDPHISFEYHFFGAVMGTLCALFLRNFDSPLRRKRYDWEDEPEETESPPQ